MRLLYGRRRRLRQAPVGSCLAPFSHMTATISYPNHPDFDYSVEVAQMRAARDQDWGRHPWIAFIVSQGWKDEGWVEDFIDKLAGKYGRATLLVPERAAGAMKIAVERAEAQDMRIVPVRSEATWGNYRQAVQASHICQLADVLMVAWAGGADLPKAVIDKALMIHRPDDRFLPGLHVYEQTKTRATRSRKSQFTGHVKYRIRDKFALTERKAA